MSNQVTVATLNGEPLRAEFPLRTTVFGVEAVVIPAAEYEELTKASLKARFVPVRVHRTVEPTRRPLPSTVERDQEVATFLRERFGAADTLEAARNACIARFGEPRTPSTSRIARFRTAVREGG